MAKDTLTKAHTDAIYPDKYLLNLIVWDHYSPDFGAIYKPLKKFLVETQSI